VIVDGLSDQNGLANIHMRARAGGNAGREGKGLKETWVA
jgi:hypothetical protein